MTEKRTEKRGGEERRMAGRRGVLPEIDAEQVFDEDFGTRTEVIIPGTNLRIQEQRIAIRREEDRLLNEELAGTGL